MFFPQRSRYCNRHSLILALGGLLAFGCAASDGLDGANSLAVDNESAAHAEGFVDIAGSGTVGQVILELEIETLDTGLQIARVAVTVHDLEGAPASGLLVGGLFDGSVEAFAEAVTDSAGIAILRSPALPVNGTVRFVLQDPAQNGDPNSGPETSPVRDDDSGNGSCEGPETSPCATDSSEKEGPETSPNRPGIESVGAAADDPEKPEGPETSP